MDKYLTYSVVERKDPQNPEVAGKFYAQVLKTVDIRSPKTVISVHFSSSKPMAMQIY